MTINSPNSNSTEYLRVDLEDHVPIAYRIAVCKAPRSYITRLIFDASNLPTKSTSSLWKIVVRTYLLAVLADEEPVVARHLCAELASNGCPPPSRDTLLEVTFEYVLEKVSGMSRDTIRRYSLAVTYLRRKGVTPEELLGAFKKQGVYAAYCCELRSSSR